MITHKTFPNGFPYIETQNKFAKAKIALQGAHVFAYETRGYEPLLWLSEKAYFAEGKAIRGGIPLCFPWFGKHKSDASLPQHGFARTTLWELVSEEELEDGSSHVILRLCESPKSLALWAYTFELTLDVYVGTSLRVVLHIRNTDTKAFEVGTALHTYFKVHNIADVSIGGLKNAKYYDALTQSHQKQESTLDIYEEIDRVYQTEGQTLYFSECDRLTCIESKGSSSVVIWNPWKEKSIAMVDMTDDGYKSMVCLETSNAREDTRTIEPDCVHSLEVLYKQGK